MSIEERLPGDMSPAELGNKICSATDTRSDAQKEEDAERARQIAEMPPHELGEKLIRAMERPNSPSDEKILEAVGG